MSVSVIEQWQAIERINVRRVIAGDRELFLDFIEEPLREAIGIMYDKNIPTVGSSCNLHDYSQGKAWISVDYDYMSSRNRKLVDRYEHMEKRPMYNSLIRRTITLAGLFFPIQPHEVPSDIGRKAVALAEKFHDQPNLLPPQYRGEA